jgi:hypothetical protein
MTALRDCFAALLARPWSFDSSPFKLASAIPNLSTRFESSLET